MLIKCTDKFEDIPTFLTTRTEADINSLKNLQTGSGLTDVPGADGVQMEQNKGQFLLPQTF